MPLERWDIERLYSPDLAAGKMYTRLGAWLTAIDQFDVAVFGMHHSEAVATDPQVCGELAECFTLRLHVLLRMHSACMPQSGAAPLRLHKPR